MQQKQIIVTCNYEARRRGLYKLQLIKDARRMCPDVVIVLGEDLTTFRDASKDLYLFIRKFIWGGRVERLGFDELSLDVTEMVDNNTELLNPNDLNNSFFHLSQEDPTVGFAYDATCFQGSTYPSAIKIPQDQGQTASLTTRLLVASHLMGYLRTQMEYEKGFTATGGVSTSKLLAKLVGSVHKPNNQTTLLPPYESPASNVTKFLDDHEIRKIPGIGSRLAQKLKTRVAGHNASEEKKELMVRDVRLFPDMGPPLLERTLGGPGSAKGIGMRVWSILHGVDNTEVLEARDLPTQISIEDSYGRGRLDGFESVRRELTVLTRSLLRRMRTDLLDQTGSKAEPWWLAHPRTLRLSTRPRNQADSNGVRTYNANRISRSAPLPSFVFHQDENIDALAERLVQEQLLAMFRRLHPEKGGWDLSLMNVAVTNLVESAGTQKQSRGRDIGQMFQQQEVVLREWAVQDPVDLAQPQSRPTAEGEWEEDEEEEEGLSNQIECPLCGVALPHFAWQAHERYHAGEERK